MANRDLQQSIQDLTDMLPAKWSTVVEAACRQDLLHHPQPERSAYKVNAQPHRYGPDDIKICDGKHGDVVFAEMRKDGRCSAPTYSSAAIYTGKIETLFPFHDLVVKLVDPGERTVYNVTLPTHIFFPGIVKLVVKESDLITSVAVSGEGTGNWKAPNTMLGPVLFYSLLKDHLASRVSAALNSVGKPSRG